ncbi:hypothetical protein D9758_001223 [Tetrapyrgos nigripes]|uniref:Uncharacterized protein n=1 Tax=Tetrapyrgos nigripes TaxID=182062 RepID=A0A8H5GSJ8_9AGAR|nr:hypothetical protein D9758_001223 [Tetrapyrgos nigripes]
MATLPSFVELMASLGIDPSKRIPDQPAPSSSLSSPSSSPKLLSVPCPRPAKSRSSPSLRDQASRRGTTRYSPYAPITSERRRGSFSSISSSDASDRADSASPRPLSSPRLRRRADNKLTVNVFGSSTDLAANTPISSYVRRKTPVASPTSPTFPREVIEESPRPFVLPTLPPFLPQSSGSDSFPVTPNSDIDGPSTGRISPDVVSDPAEAGILSRRSRIHTGIRISTPPRSTDIGGKYPHSSVVHVA